MAPQVVPSQTQQAGSVVYTYVPQVTNLSTNTDTQSQAGLNVGWVVAIVTLVLLATALAYTFWNWRRQRSAGRYGQTQHRYAEPQEYTLQRPRAARVRDSMARFSSRAYA